MKRALICGISGQDGAYLAELLISKGYCVFGTSRDINKGDFENLKKLGISAHTKLVPMMPTETNSIHHALRISNPDEVYNLSGQSSVGFSFEKPEETMASIVDVTLNILDTIKLLKPEIRFFNAGSSECFGSTEKGMPADENTAFNPRSPYATAKAKAYHLVKNYRDTNGLFACTGILFNHESPLRQGKFVTQKIIQGATQIAKDINNGHPPKKIHLGNLSIRRDWGWAPEYVEAMWLMIQQAKPEDFVIATGQCHSLQEFVEKVFSKLDLNWRDYVVIDEDLFRPNEAIELGANPSKAKAILDWQASTQVDGIISEMIAEASGYK
jgi:GDPmannose 4,6-dehydratase